MAKNEIYICLEFIHHSITEKVFEIDDQEVSIEPVKVPHKQYFDMKVYKLGVCLLLNHDYHIFYNLKQFPEQYLYLNMQ